MAGKVRVKILTAKTKQILDRVTLIHGLSKAVNAENKDLFIQQTKDLNHTQARFEEMTQELEEVKLEVDSEYQPSFSVLADFMTMVDEIKVTLSRVCPPPPPRRRPRPAFLLTRVRVSERRHGSSLNPSSWWISMVLRKVGPRFLSSSLS